VMARYRWLGVFILILTLGFSLPVLGQSQEAAELKSAEGRAFYDDQKFDLALASFKAAFVLHPSSRYLFNSAKACVRLDDGEGAVYFFERYLMAKPVAEDRLDVLTEMDELRGKLLASGRREVRLKVKPAEAVIEAPVGHPTEVVLAPASLFLAPGSYIVGFKVEGFLEQKAAVEVAAVGPALITVEATLEKPVAGNSNDPESKIEPDPTFSSWPWVMLGVGGAGVVAAGAGGYLWYDGWAGMGDTNDNGGPDYTNNYRAARDRYVAGQWVTAAGAVVAVGGVLGYYLWPRQAGALAPSVSLVPRDDGFMLGVGAWF
jgi:hypothetical protein